MELKAFFKSPTHAHLFVLNLLRSLAKLLIKDGPGFKQSFRAGKPELAAKTILNGVVAWPGRSTPKWGRKWCP